MAEDALARARAIAAKLSGGISGTAGGSDLGKRKNRWDDDPTTGGFGLGAIQKKKVYIPVKEHPGVNFLGLLIGPRGATQKQMQEASGAKILIRGRGAYKDGAAQAPHVDDEDDLHVSIEGTEDAIRRAEKDIEQILFNPEQAMKLKDSQLQSLAEMNGQAHSYGGGQSGGADEYQIEMRVPNHMVGLVIGKGGENIHRMQTQTGAHMQIAKESDMKPGDTLRSIWLKGNSSNVAELKQRVEEIINARLNQGQQTTVTKVTSVTPDYAYVIKLPVPNDKVGVVIGKGGMTIKSIQEKTRTNVQIPTGPDDDNPAVRTLSIGADTQEAAEACQMEIYLVLQQQAQQQAQQMSTMANAIHLAVPDDKIGLVIGKGGMTIKDIQARCRVKIQVPQAADPGTNPPVRTITISGPPECQHVARYEIEMVVAGQGHSVGVGSMASPSAGTYGNPWGAQSVAPAAQYGVPFYGTGAGGMMYPGYSMPGVGAYDMQAYYAAQQAAVVGAQTGVNMYGAQATQGFAQQDTAATSSSATAEGSVPTDPTAYYNDFWLYCTYYGEAAARAYYGAWSPPEGTPPPAGTVLPGSSAQETFATQERTAELHQQQQSALVSEVNAHTSIADRPATDAALRSETAASTLSADGFNTVNASSAYGGANGNGSTAQDQDNDIISSDPVAQAAWEEYKKQYKKWYEEHGRAAGADPNPPRPG